MSPSLRFRLRRALEKCAALASLAIYIAAVAQNPGIVPANPAVVPEERADTIWWETKHKEVLAYNQLHPETQLVLIGDSITNNYEKANPPDENFQPTWKQFYEPRHAINLGFSGDTTANVLWRLDHGEVDGLHPRVALLLIGTNNTGGYNETALQTEAGIDAVLRNLQRRLPKTHILLLGILPSGISAEKTERDRAVNQYLATTYARNRRITYLDIGAIFFQDGRLNADIFYDPRLPGHAAPLHPDTMGQRRMAEAIEPTLAKLMGDKPKLSAPEIIAAGF
jgi:lysophospholipase L1-like esterase